MAGEDKATLARAWALVAYFFGEGTSPPAGVAPELLDRIVTLHRLYGALADPRLAVRSPEAFVTPEIWQRWRRLHGGALAQAVLRAAPLRKVFEALAPLEAIVFKGAALAELIYPSPGDRPMTDVDLLVRPDAAPEAARRLLALGYRCYFWGHPFFHRRYYYEWPFAGPDLEIDLHRGFTQQTRIAADYAGLFDRSLGWPALAPNARLLAPEDAVVVQAIQPGRNELSLSGFPAIGLLDLKVMLEREGPFWGRAGGPPLRLEEVARRAAEWRAEPFVQLGLSYAARLFPSLGGRASAAGPLLPSWRRRELDRWILDRAFPPPLSDPTRSDVWIRKLLLVQPRALLRLSAERVSGLVSVALRRLSQPRPEGPGRNTPLAKRLLGELTIEGFAKPRAAALWSGRWQGRANSLTVGRPRA